jgi:hypothetical protein
MEDKDKLEHSKIDYYLLLKSSCHVSSDLQKFLLFVNAFLAITSHFSTYCHFLCPFVPSFWVSLSILCARKLLLLKSLFLDKNLNQIDSIIPTLIIFILRNASSIGWVVVAVAVAGASVVLVVQKALHWHHLIRVLCLFGSDPKLTRCQ